MWSPLVHNFTHLLWQIVGSHAFQLHLQVIADHLCIPRYHSADTYELFADTQCIHIAYPGMCNQEEDDEADFASSFQTSAKVQEEYGRLISNHVAYLGAIFLLKQYCEAPPIGATNTINFNMHLIMSPSPTAMTVSWHGIQEVLKGLSRDPHHEQEMIDAIADIVTEKIHAGTKMHHIFEKFWQLKDSGQEGIQYYGVVHPETLLGSLINFSSQAIQGEGINTSKLCGLMNVCRIPPIHLLTFQI
jgi:hypothetical protein